MNLCTEHLHPQNGSLESPWTAQELSVGEEWLNNCPACGDELTTACGAALPKVCRQKAGPVDNGLALKERLWRNWASQALCLLQSSSKRWCQCIWHHYGTKGSSTLSGVLQGDGRALEGQWHTWQEFQHFAPPPKTSCDHLNHLSNQWEALENSLSGHMMFQRGRCETLKLLLG